MLEVKDVLVRVVGVDAHEMQVGDGSKAVGMGQAEGLGTVGNVRQQGHALDRFGVHP